MMIELSAREREKARRRRRRRRRGGSRSSSSARLLYRCTSTAPSAAWPRSPISSRSATSPPPATPRSTSSRPPSSPSRICASSKARPTSATLPSPAAQTTRPRGRPRATRCALPSSSSPPPRPPRPTRSQLTTHPARNRAAHLRPHVPHPRRARLLRRARRGPSPLQGARRPARRRRLRVRFRGGHVLSLRAMQRCTSPECAGRARGEEKRSARSAAQSSRSYAPSLNRL